MPSMLAKCLSIVQLSVWLEGLLNRLKRRLQEGSARLELDCIAIDKDLRFKLQTMKELPTPCAACIF